MFVKNEYGSMKMCNDYRELNNVKMKTYNHMPRIDDLFDRL